MKTKHTYIILILTTIVNTANLSYAQNNCLTLNDLNGIYDKSLDAITEDFQNRNWSLETDNSNDTKYFFEERLDLSVKKWQNRKSKNPEGILSVYHKNNKPYLIIYQKGTNDCFNLVLSQLGNNIKTSQKKDFKVIENTQNKKIELREYINDVYSDKRFSILIYNESAVNGFIRDTKYQIAFGNGDKFFNQGKYIEAIAVYNIALSLSSDEENIISINQKIANCERRLEIDKFIEQGIYLYEAKNFNEALNQFQQAKSKITPDESELSMKVDDKIKSCKNNLNQIALKDTINITIKSADSLYNNNDYINSKTKYEIAKRYSVIRDPLDHSQVKELELKIESCKNLIKLADIFRQLDEFDKDFRLAQDLLIKRKYNEALYEFNKTLNNYSGIQSLYQSNSALKYKNLELRIEKSIENTRFEIEKANNLQTTFSYAKINKNDFMYFRNKNYYLLNSMVSSENSGMLNYNAKIEFDDLGNNKSALNIISFGSKNIQSNLTKGVDFSGLSASQKYDYFVPSYELLSFNLKWTTSVYTVNSKKSEINITPYKSGKYELYQIESFVKKQDFKRGVYKFEVVEKQLNGETFTDINLINYRNNAGPAKAFNSAIWPGWGKYKVTNGEKGGGKALFFLLMTGITIGSKYYSEIQYENYANSSDQIEADIYYEKADIANKVFLVSGGIVAFTYIHEFFWVFGKGIKNNKQTRKLKETLKKGPVKVSDSPLKPE